MTSLLLLLSTALSGQVWIDQGAKWYYDWSGILPAFDMIEYSGDTVVQDKICQKLVTTSYIFTPIEAGGELIDTYSTQNFTFANGDTVFYLAGNQFHILYNFAAQIGDTWELGVDTNETYCGKSVVEVQSKGSTLINDQICEWIEVNTLPNSSVGLSGRIYKRFGAGEDYLFPTPRNCDSAIVEWNIYNFSCFEDVSFPLYNVTSQECDYLLHLGTGEFENKEDDVIIYPNPSREYISILNADLPLDYIILDLYGKILKKGRLLPHNEISINELSAGIYLLVLTHDANAGTKDVISSARFIISR